MKDVFTRYYRDLGGKIVLSEAYNDDERDFRGILSKLLGKRAQALYLPGYYKTIGLIAVQAKELGIVLRLFSNVGVEDPKLFEIAANAVEGLTLNSHDIVRVFL